MRITVILLLTASLHVAAYTEGQNVTLNVKDAPVKEVFREIQKQTGLNVMMDESLIEKMKNITLNVHNVTVSEVLNICFQNESLIYTISDGRIIVKSAQPLPSGGGSSFSDSLSPPPPIDIHGHITDSLGNPLVGASIIVKGGRKGTQTDAKGDFVLHNVNDNATLVISYTGYGTKQFKINGNNDVAVFLNKSNSPLDEIQVIAYGNTTQRLATGDITTVTSKEIEQQPVSDPLLALEGRVPGMLITQNTGVPGGGITVQIQGLNSFQAGTLPLYVIDGVPYESQPITNLSGQTGILGSSGNGYGGGSALSFINPADIESISILKDADATSIYGSRAANGAVLITTKKGKAGQTKTDVNFQDGWGRVTRFMPMLNTQQYLQMRHRAFNNDGAAPGPTDYDINGTWDTTRNTNWQKVLLGGTSQFLTANGSVSGGTTNTQFLIGAGYQRQTTVFPGDLADQKGSFHININHVSANQRFRVMANAEYLADNNQLISQDPTSLAFQLSPDAPALKNGNGTLNWAPLPNGTSTWYNPLAYLNNTYSSKTGNLISNAVLSYQLMPGLDLKSSFGYNSINTNEFQLFPFSAVAPDQIPYNLRYSVFGNNTGNSWIIEPQLSYKHALGKWKIDALVGSTIEQNNSQYQSELAYGFNSDFLLQDLSAAPNLIPNGNTYSVYKYQAVFARVNYNWMDKYIIDLNWRRDGSSRFGADNIFHNFWSAAGAWLFSNEGFVKNTIPFISFGKLRVSYGTTGNDQIGDYQYLSIYNPLVFAVPYQQSGTLLPSGLANPHLQWEQTNKLQFGLNLGFLKDRILLSANYNLNRSSNLLQNYLLPSITGVGGILENFPATIQNTGWELTLTTVNIRTKLFTWSSSINFTAAKNKLIAFPNLATSPYASAYSIGQPVNIAKALHFLGVDPITGFYQVADSKGTPTTTPNPLTDNTSIINPNPKFYGGFDNNFSYKGFELDVFFQFVKKIAANNFYGLRQPGLFSSGATVYSQGYNNQPTYILNAWQKSGDIAAVQKYSTVYNSPSSLPLFSDASYSDASFVRLKNLSLSWHLPAAWLQRAALQNVRIYAQGQNLFTITKYKGMDPENANILALPPSKIFTLGIQIGF